IVSRYLDGAKSYDDTLLTRIGNFIYTKLIGNLFGFYYTDALVIFRAYKTSLPKRFNMTKRRSILYEKIIGKYISWEPQLSVKCAKHKLKIAEIPGDEPVRIADIGVISNTMLPKSRIQHYRSALAILYMIFEEYIKGRNN
ncbi:MAG: hypothetical protein HQK93_08735, partial [Nitrospirae bacterium]|nr:hypothetical protein [Nitrospirota bacterium]